MRFGMTAVILICWVLSVIGIIAGIKMHRKWMCIAGVCVFCFNTAGTIWAWIDLYG